MKLRIENSPNLLLGILEKPTSYIFREKKIKYGSELFDSNVLYMSKLTFEENDLQFLKLKRRKQH